VQRPVRKDGTVAYLGQDFEVPYELSGKRVRLIVDPHAQQVIGVEDEGGNRLGTATPLDALANCHRRRRKPAATNIQTAIPPAAGPNRVELAFEQHYAHIPEEKA
jgi:putative transposase